MRNIKNSFFSIDLDECSVPSINNCENLAACNNTLGSFICQCPSGYQLNLNGQSCDDIDEASLGLDNCSSYAFAVNTIGSFECVCLAGYEKNQEQLCIGIISFYSLYMLVLSLLANVSAIYG